MGAYCVGPASGRYTVRHARREPQSDWTSGENCQRRGRRAARSYVSRRLCRDTGTFPP